MLTKFTSSFQKYSTGVLLSWLCFTQEAIQYESCIVMQNCILNPMNFSTLHLQVTSLDASAMTECLCVCEKFSILCNSLVSNKLYVVFISKISLSFKLQNVYKVDFIHVITPLLNLTNTSCCNALSWQKLKFCHSTGGGGANSNLIQLSLLPQILSSWLYLQRDNEEGLLYLINIKYIIEYFISF